MKDFQQLRQFIFFCSIGLNLHLGPRLPKSLHENVDELKEQIKKAYHFMSRSLINNSFHIQHGSSLENNL